MKDITFHFVTTEEPPSILIRWKTDSSISHVEVLTPDGKYLGALMDGGIQARPTNYTKWSKEILITIQVSDDQYDQFWSYCNKQVGEKYDSKGILGIALGKSVHEDNEKFCSEFMTDALMSTTPPIIFVDADAWRITPEDVRKLLRAVYPNSTVVTR